MDNQQKRTTLTPFSKVLITSGAIFGILCATAAFKWVLNYLTN